MKEALLKIFQQHEGEFVSGEKISEQLGCSRTAVWKHIEELRKSGYELESAPRKGYRLLHKPDGIRPHEVKLHLQTKRFGREITYFDSVSSTQTIAHQLVQKGVEEGHVVIANEQTAGKGRLGRTWFSHRDTTISMSVILRPPLPPQQTPQLTLLTAVAVVRAINKATGLDCDIKWPNDVLINGKKVVGILTEMHAELDIVRSVVIGIGMNVNDKRDEIPASVKEVATSLAIEKGETLKRAPLIAEVLNEIEQLYDLYLDRGFKVIRPLWEAHSISLYRHIRARTAQNVIYGYAKGISDEGVLLIEDEHGNVHEIYSADIDIPPQNV